MENWPIGVCSSKYNCRLDACEILSQDKEKPQKIQTSYSTQNFEESDYEDCIDFPERECDSKTTTDSHRSKATGFVTCSSNIDTIHGISRTTSKEGTNEKMKTTDSYYGGFSLEDEKDHKLLKKIKIELQKQEKMEQSAKGKC